MKYNNIPLKQLKSLVGLTDEEIDNIINKDFKQSDNSTTYKDVNMSFDEITSWMLDLKGAAFMEIFAERAEYYKDRKLSKSSWLHDIMDWHDLRGLETLWRRVVGSAENRTFSEELLSSKDKQTMLLDKIDELEGAYGD